MALALEQVKKLPGLSPEAELALRTIINQLIDGMRALPAQDLVTDVQAQPYVARIGDIARVKAGGQLTLPPANSTTAGKTVCLIVVGSGSVTVVAQAATQTARNPGGKTQGTVNGAASDRVSGPGLSYFRSDGAGGWFSTSSSESGSAATAAAASAAAGELFSANAAGDSMALQNGGRSLGYVGAGDTQGGNINISPTAGALGVVSLVDSTTGAPLKCGGILTFQTVTEASIAGFPVPTRNGFWFILHNRDASTSDVITLLENSGNTVTSIRTPDIRDLRLYKNDAVLVYYSNNRWRVVATAPRLFLLGVDSVTWAAQQNNYQRTSRGVNRIRVTLTGPQALTGVVPDQSTSGSPNGEILVIDNIDSADALTIVDASSSSTAANQFLLPGRKNLVLQPGDGATFAYDDTSARWRCIGLSTLGLQLTQTSSQTVTNSTTALTAGTLTLPPNALDAGSEYEIEAVVHTSRGATATASNVVLRLNIDGVAARSITLATTTTSGHLGYAIVKGSVTCRTTGAGGTVMATLVATEAITNATATPATNTPRVNQDPAPAAAVVAASAFDTTVSHTLEFSANFSVGVASLAMHMYRCSIKKVR